MSLAIAVTLLLFAALGFAGAGISLAAARIREVTEVESDLGLKSVALMLFAFASACALVVTGLSGVCAFGGVVTWFSYVITAHRLGVFWVEQPGTFEALPAERKRIA